MSHIIWPLIWTNQKPAKSERKSKYRYDEDVWKEDTEDTEKQIVPGQDDEEITTGGLKLFELSRNWNLSLKNVLGMDSFNPLYCMVCRCSHLRHIGLRIAVYNFGVHHWIRWGTVQKSSLALIIKAPNLVSWKVRLLIWFYLGSVSRECADSQWKVALFTELWQKIEKLKSVQLTRVWEIRVESGERASDLELQSASTSATVTTEQVRVFVIFHRFQEKSPLWEHRFSNVRYILYWPIQELFERTS